MTHNFEYELKLMLSEDEYKKLFSMKGERGFLQVNHYFETPGFDMWEKGAVIRVREIKNKYELTVKKKNATGDAEGVIAMDEYNNDICPEVALGLIEGRLDVTDFLPEDDIYKGEVLKNIGSIATFRRKIRISEGLPMAELDKSVYSDIVDFELEWEIDDKDYEPAVKALGELGIGISDRAVGMSKFKRLSDTLRKG